MSVPSTDALPEQLLHAVEQLSPNELATLTEYVSRLRAKHIAPSLPADESTLLLRINHPIPADLQRRYDALRAKHQEDTLTTDEYETLLRLTDEIELLEAERVKALAELAQLRQVSIIALMDELGIRGPAHA